MNEIYIAGPGDVLGQYTGHPHDPRTPDGDGDDDDPTVDVIHEVRQFLGMAEVAASKGEWNRVKQALVEARLSLENLVGVEQ